MAHANGGSGQEFRRHLLGGLCTGRSKVEFLLDNRHGTANQEIMSRRPRRNHTPAFKTKLARAAV
jgi:hypothetical protein